MCGKKGCGFMSNDKREVLRHMISLHPEMGETSRKKIENALIGKSAWIMVIGMFVTAAIAFGITQFLIKTAHPGIKFFLLATIVIVTLYCFWRYAKHVMKVENNAK